MKNTLFSKMLLIYLSVTLALLILLGVTASSIFVQHYISERKLELSREGGEISAVISDKYMTDEKRNVALDELLTIARKYDGLIQLKFTDDYYGTVSVVNTSTDSAKKWEFISEYFDYMSELDLGAEDTTETNVFSKLVDMRTMTLAMPIKSDNDIVGTLCFTVDMTDTYAVIESVVVDIVIFSALGIVLAFIAVFYVTELITRPIATITRTVSSFTKGEFKERIHLKSTDEIGELAVSFNQMADELNTLEEARRSFLANVSHELRSPLASMRGFLVAMQDGTIAPEDYSKYLPIVIDENNRLIDMVNDILAMARIESSGEKAMSFEVFELTEVILATLITFEARINSKHIDVDLRLGNNHTFVYADRGQIIHVLRNLIDNAIKFTPDSGLLHIELQITRQKVWVIVKDSGPGIAEDDLPHVFERFYKAEKAHTRNGTGTGLGLAIVKRIIDAHEQTITVENDKGACFKFSLKHAQRPRRLHN